MFYWNDKEVKTVGDVIRVMLEAESKQEVHNILKKYSQINDYARTNINYVLLGFNDKDRKRIQSLLEDYPA